METQSERLKTFTQTMQNSMVIDESFIVNNWKNVDLKMCRNPPKYSALSELYDSDLIDVQKLSTKICKWEHKTDRTVNTKSYDSESFPFVQKSVQIQQFMMDELFVKYGIVCVLRAGELLSVFRDGGHFPWEKSSDQWCILPKGLSMECFHELNVILMQQKEIKSNYFGYQWQNDYKYKAGGASGYGFQQYLKSFPFKTRYQGFETHGSLLDFDLIKNTKFNALFNEKYTVKPIEYFNDESMCLCNYGGAIAFGFEEEAMDNLLRVTYGDYMNPRPGYKGPYDRRGQMEIGNFALWENDNTKARKCYEDTANCFV